MKNTYKLFALILIISVIPTMVSAGLGARFGFSKDAQNDNMDKGMTLLAVDYRFSALPMVDIIGTIEYSWKKYPVDGVIVTAEGTHHFFTANFSVVKPFDLSLLKPYAGFGYGFHKTGNSVSIMGTPVGKTENGTGFHVIGGLKISPPAAPIAVYGEWRHYWTNFDAGNGRYFTFSAGVMLGF